MERSILGRWNGVGWEDGVRDEDEVGAEEVREKAKREIRWWRWR